MENSPVSFGEALILNSEAMDIYLKLPRHTQEEIINKASCISSPKEMKAFVETIVTL